MRTPALHRLGSLFARLALLVGIWAVVFSLFAAQLVFTASFPWANALRLSALNWLPWLVLAPAVLWLAGRFPLEAGRLWRSLPVHLVACAASFVAINATTELLFERGALAGLTPVPRDGPPNALRGGRPDFSRGERPDFFREDGVDVPRGGPRGGFPRGGKRGGPGGLGGPRGPGPGGFGPLFSRANLSIPIYLLLVTAAHAAAYYRRAQDRDRQALVLEAGLNQAKLDALRLQLQPHFLFNTLNAISTLVHRDANAADELIGDLSELLRLSLLTTAHEVPLARELELLDCYLAIEQTRLGDRLRIVRAIEPAATSALVPTFVLQPLAENAVRHGLEPRSAPGTITISARREGGTLRLTVADDGVGLASGQGVARRGIGLANTEARLQALHGTSAKLELHTPPEGGLRAELTLPCRTTPASTQT
ncbi:MAG: hypothetical protein EXS32_05215 [Opitutus sp.]|nr:hypothetical protein [Opitutus sp.]